MQLRYSLDDRPPLPALLGLGAQWFAVALPGAVVIGQVVATVHQMEPAELVLYLQKMLFLIGIALFFQAMWGHRLPLVLGPSSVLLVGVVDSRGASVDAVYSSIILGGAVLALVSWSGLFGYLQKLFTTRVVAVVLLLIAFALAPTVMQLITDNGGNASPLAAGSFAVAMVLGMFFFYRTAGGLLRSTLILWALPAGSGLCYLLFSEGLNRHAVCTNTPWSFFFTHLTTHLCLEPGLLVSFLFCYLALAVNDLGSIQSMQEILGPPDMPKRINRGITFTGLANVMAGILGVLGTVNFSLSPGVITATGCGSRFTLLPAAALLVLLSFSPFLVGLMGSIPPVVIGSVLLYILCHQVAAGLIIAFRAEKNFSVDHGLVFGLPLLLGTIISFLPESAVGAFPPLLRPILGNGFVVGVLACVILEHGMFRT